MEKIKLPQYFEKKWDGENYSSKIVLNFFRHSIRKKSEQHYDEKFQEQADIESPLTEEGVDLALEHAVELKNYRLAKAIGSPRVRAQETAAFIMAGDKNRNFQELKKDINLLGDPRIVDDERLDFQFNPKKSETSRKTAEALSRRNFLKFLVEQSDQLAEENHDCNMASTYSKAAANIASIIKQYADGSDRWDKIVQAEDTRKFPKGYQKELERFFGSHQGIIESFLAKVIDKTQGREARDRFVVALNNQGFDYVEGFTVNIFNQNGLKKIIANYQKKDSKGIIEFGFNEEIPSEVIDKIIAEWNEKI